MKFLDIFKKNNKKGSLVNQFTIIIGTSIFITLLFVTAYNLYASIPIIRQYRIDKDFSHKSIMNLSVENYKDDLNQNDNHFTNLQKISKSLIKNKLALYINIIDKKSGNYKWSTISGLIGTKANNYDVWKNPVFALKYKWLGHENLKQISEKIENTILVIGFPDNNGFLTLINVLLKGNIILIMIFIIFGFVSAFTLAKFVTKPIKKLVLEAEEFSKGNLKHRSSIETKDEIGILAMAFNDMAEKLDILYSSLEQQVKDRTNELVEKNEQLESAYKELKEAQSMLIHSEKMKSLGQLVAGVAHELNNPINFIYGNLDHLKNYTDDLIKIIDAYQEINEKLAEADLTNIENVKKDADYEFILDDLPTLIKSCKDGTERCKQIVLDLKNFSRLDEAIIKEVNIHEGIESTLNILYNKYKHRINVHKNYGELPKLSCYAGQLNQVFMNILDNAGQAISEKGDIYIKTRFENDNIVIIFEDNGSGIDQEIMSRIFDPFFTTKPVGGGTGLGLSISYKIIKTHNGTISVESTKGKGTIFTIKIPLYWYKKSQIVAV